LVVGGRYTIDNRELVNIESRKWNSFTPRVVVAYDIGQANIYASYNKGFKAGGFNTPAAAPPANSVEPETINSYEAGIKFASNDGRLHVNLAAFTYDYKNIQVTVIDQLHGGSVLQNAASATGRGAELDVDYRPVHALQLLGGFSFLHARYDSYKNAQVQVVTFDSGGSPNGIGVGFEDLSGTPLVRAPSFTGYVGATLLGSVGGGWQGEVTALARHSSSFVFSPGGGGPLGTDVQPAYSTVDLSGKISSPSGQFDVGLFVKNLTDETYYNFRFTTAPFGAMQYVARPRTFGLRLAYKF
jgi:iron complex outermembrane receptor protein